MVADSKQGQDLYSIFPIKASVPQCIVQEIVLFLHFTIGLPTSEKVVIDIFADDTAKLKKYNNIFKISSLSKK